jgi:hypothetical protein
VRAFVPSESRTEGVDLAAALVVGRSAGTTFLTVREHLGHRALEATQEAERRDGHADAAIS